MISLGRCFGGWNRPWRPGSGSWADPWAACALGAILAAGGCTEAPYAATDAFPLTPQEARARAVLDAGEQAAALDAMRLAGPGHTPRRRAEAAPAVSGGMRWSDLAAAVAGACDDVEAAVTGTVAAEGGHAYYFDLRTIEDWPGELVVTRMEPPEVYRAEAWIGRFSDEPARRARAQALVEALARHMKALGRKRRYPDVP